MRREALRGRPGVARPAEARRSRRPPRRHEVVEQPPELALDVDVAVRAPDERQPAVRREPAPRPGGAAGRT